MDETRTIDEATTYALDLTNLSAGWVRKADVPDGRNHVAAAGLDGYFYVLGGQHGQEEDQAALGDVDRYDPSTDQWTVMASLPVYAGKSHISEGTFAFGDRIIVIGGEQGFDDPQTAIESYDPATNTWTKLGTLPAARSTVIAGVVGNRLIVTTGNGPSATDTTWVGTLS
jgi:N-acetylneuraminic acid mutarotase